MQMSVWANGDLVNIPPSSFFLTVQRTASVLPLCATAVILEGISAAGLSCGLVEASYVS